MKNEVVDKGVEAVEIVPIDFRIQKCVYESYSGGGFEFTFEPVEGSLVIDKTVSGYKAKYLTIDNSPLNPRSDDNIGNMFCEHRRYDLGDKHSYVARDFNSWDDFKAKIEEDYDVALIYPLFIYDHSGLRIKIGSFNDRWDGGQVGFIFVTKEKIKDIYGEPEDLMEDVLKNYLKKAKVVIEGEVETYDNYISGDVYCTVVEKFDENKVRVDYDIVGGYYGYKYALDALKVEKKI